MKADADTVYPISSVSRTFAGVLAVGLVDAGLLNLDDSISEYLDGVPADKKALTVRHLLQHTHGLEDFYRSDAYPDQDLAVIALSNMSGARADILPYEIARVSGLPGE